MATSSTIYPEADSFIRSDSTTGNWGSQTVLRVGEYSGGNRRHAVIRFDVSSFTNPTDIVSANFTLTEQTSYGSVTRPMILARLDQDFVESTVTWDESATGVSWTGGAGGASNGQYTEPTYTVNVGNNEGDQTVDIKDLVVDAITRRSGTLLLILCFAPTDSSSGVGNTLFKSREAATGLPQIVITVADRVEWTGAIDGDLDTSGNWSTGLPQSTDIAIFSSGNAVTGGILTCERVYITEGFVENIGTPSATGIRFVISNSIYINKSRGMFHLSLTGGTTVIISNTSEAEDSSKLSGTYESTLINTRSEVYLADNAGDTIIVAGDKRTDVKARCAAACDVIQVGGRYTMEDGCRDFLIVDGRAICNAGTILDMNLWGGSTFNNVGGIISGDVFIYNGQLNFKNNDDAEIETEDVILYANGILDARTSAGTYSPNSEIETRGGGNFALDAGYSLEIT
jgi:hypothetical protein